MGRRRGRSFVKTSRSSELGSQARKFLKRVEGSQPVGEGVVLEDFVTPDGRLCVKHQIRRYNRRVQSPEEGTLNRTRRGSWVCLGPCLVHDEDPS